MAPPPPTVITRARRTDDRLEVALVDVADPTGHPLAALDVTLPPGRAARIDRIRLAPTAGSAVAVSDPYAPLARRLLDAGADELRALGRRRVTTSLGRDDGTLDHLRASGWSVVRDDGTTLDLVLEL